MCLEIAKERMSAGEAKRALGELVRGQQTPEDLAHYRELQKSSDEELVKKAKEFAKQSGK
jgi:Asp-tRNA(Asn)/Glu-tRNA(Gln) amidotransferase B subunit